MVPTYRVDAENKVSREIFSDPKRKDRLVVRKYLPWMTVLLARRSFRIPKDAASLTSKEVHLLSSGTPPVVERVEEHRRDGTDPFYSGTKSRSPCVTGGIGKNLSVKGTFRDDYSCRIEINGPSRKGKTL